METDRGRQRQTHREKESYFKELAHGIVDPNTYIAYSLKSMEQARMLETQGRVAIQV